MKETSQSKYLPKYQYFPSSALVLLLKISLETNTGTMEYQQPIRWHLIDQGENTMRAISTEDTLKKLHILISTHSKYTEFEQMSLS